jgi:hypothetical protein
MGRIVRWWVGAFLISGTIEYLLMAVYFRDLLFLGK